MIIKDKILKKYTKEELNNILGKRKDYFYRKNFKCTIQYIVNIFDIDSLNYNLNDFLADYPTYALYKENETLFNIFKAGYTLRSFSKKYDIDMGYVNTQLRKGFIYNSTSIPNILFKFINLNYPFNKFMKIEYYKKHIEIYDKKEILEKFRETFNLKEKVYFEKYKNSWHLAIQGFLAEYIRWLSNK